jgi:hypothetical protein
VELNDSNHLILKEDDIIGILETDDAKDMKPLSDRVLIKVVISFCTSCYINIGWFRSCAVVNYVE